MLTLLYCTVHHAYTHIQEPQYFNHHWDKPESYYKKLVSQASSINGTCSKSGTKITGQFIDASPDYLHSKSTPGNMLLAWGPLRLGAKRLVAILRDPVAREFSWYNHLVKCCIPSIRRYMFKNNKKRLLGDAEINKACLVDKRCRWLCGRNTTDVQVDGVNVLSYRREMQALRSFEDYTTHNDLAWGKSSYADNLERWFAVFQRQQVLVLNFEQLIRKDLHLINVVAQHYELTQNFSAEIKLPKSNAASRDPTLEAQLLCSTVDRLEANQLKGQKDHLYKLLSASTKENPRPALEPAFGNFTRAKCVDKRTVLTDEITEDAFVKDAHAEFAKEKDNVTSHRQVQET
jgi:hypothetical protein